MSTVRELTLEMFGIEPSPAVARFDESGWSYDETIESRCPDCRGDIHSMGKPYTSGGRSYRYAAFVCVDCVRTFTLQDLGYKSRQALIKGASKAKVEPSNPLTAKAREDLPALTLSEGLSGVREWHAFDARFARDAIEGALLRWGGSLPDSETVASGMLPNGTRFSARHVDGSSGAITALVVEHQRTSWGCLSSEVRVVEPADGDASLHLVTVECDAHPERDTGTISIVREVAEHSGMTVFGVDPYRIGNTNASSVAKFVEMLRSPDRTVPIVLLSGTNRDEQANGLVSRLNGAALVATIDGDASWALTDSLGASLGCYAGAARVYPPFNNGMPRGDCPIWVSRRIAQNGWTAVATEIVSTALTARQAPRRPGLEADLQRKIAGADLATATSEIQRLQEELRELRTATLTNPSADADTEIDAIFDAQNVTIERLEAERDEFLERSLELEQRLSETESARQGLQLALSHQQWAQRSGDSDQSVVIVDVSVEAAIERMGDPTGALVCTENALRGWRDARYPDPDRMLQTLQRLEAAASEWRASNSEIGERLGDWIQRTTGLRYAGSDQELEKRGLGSFEFENRTWSRVPHIKVDDAKHSNQVGRIYFAIDSRGSRWVVDHVGQKLYGR